MLEQERFLLFIEYFNSSKFMSAQTTLDEIWIKDQSADRDFYGGLIQMAVAMYHLTDGNPRGAQRIFQRAKGMVSNYGDVYKNVEIKDLIEKIEHIFNEDPEPDLPSIEYLKMVPKINVIGETQG